MTDGQFAFNSKVLPPPSIVDDPTAIVQLIDPTLYQICVFFKQLINTNVAPRFIQEATACGLTHATLDNWMDNVGVAQVTAFPLNELTLKGNDFKFPMLNVIVEHEEPHQISLTNSGIKRDFCVSWVLPPLTSRQYNRLYYFLGLVSKIWIAYGQQGYDPKVPGQSAWKTAGLSFGTLNEINFDHFKGRDKEGKLEVDFPCIRFRLSFFERNQMPVPQNFETFTGITLIENLYDGYNIANPINNFIDGYVEPSITLTGCTPNTGTINGYTQLVITGTGFEPSKLIEFSQVSVCGASAANVVMTSPTIMTVITNPGIALGTGDIVFTDRQGNTYTLANGFTYT